MTNLRSFFDSSILIPAFLEDHEHHQRSFTVFANAEKSNDCCAAHSLAEVYATMTRLPGRHRLSGEQVLLFLEEIRRRLTLITLSSGEYYTAIKTAAEATITCGTIYDALIAACAIKANVSTLYTWNVRHFAQLGPVVEKLLRTP